MTENAHTETRPSSGGQFTDSIGRVWNEIKQITKQVETETRKSGRSARLRLDIRRLRKDETDVRARLGKAVYEARLEHGDGIALQDVEGFAGGVAALDALGEQIAAKEAEIEKLRQTSVTADQPLEGSEEVA